MLLVVDVGNTHTVLGCFKTSRLVAGWRIATKPEATADELAVTVTNLFQLKGISFEDISGAIISSVVPPVTASLTEMSNSMLKIDPFIISPATKTGIAILYDNQHEVGADRIANAVAGFEIYGGPLIVVDFGTATTFDAITGHGEYLGGAIAPGVEISYEALFTRAARLSKVDLTRPAKAIGRNTQNSIQSGIIIGAGGLVDRIIDRFEREMGPVKHVVATGGLAELIAPECERVTAVDPILTLVGLQLIYEKQTKI